jgi:hypothetical protein
MEIGFETIGNATLICHDDRPILTTDPWVQGSAYFGSWKLSHEVPAEQLDAVRRCEYAWFSHGHPDHLNADTLPLLRGRQILLPDHVGGRIRADLERQGFQVRLLRDREWTPLSPHIRVLCIADYNQDGILLVDINGRLIVNLNDASNRGWAGFVRQIIRRYPISYLLALHGYGDADMINFFSEDGERVPLPPRVPLGQTIARQCDYYGARFFIPFSSMHRYQRTDSAWAAPIAAALDDYARGFNAERCQILPAFIRVDCARDSVTRIDPPPTPDQLYPPEHFGDDWAATLEGDEPAKVSRYFGRIEKLHDAMDFLNVRVGGQDHYTFFTGSRVANATRLISRRQSKGLTLEAPRRSLMAAIEYEVFDDLLIGNFARVTLHGKWGARKLYPEFTPYVAKYADNGRAVTRDELRRYFAAYRRRDPLGHLQGVAEAKLLLPLQQSAGNAIRGTLGPQSSIYRELKKAYWYLRRAV